jgi:chromate transporter
MTEPAYSLRQLVLYALKLGTIGFGGPIALIGYMHRDLVVKRQWISEEDYKDGLALAQLAPGPLAAQMAMYLGFVDFGVLGATLVGIAFVLPSFLMVLALGWAYQHYGGIDWMQSVFYGVGASVIGIILISAYRLTARTIGRDWILWVVYLAAVAVTVITESEKVLLFLAAGLLVWLIKAPPLKAQRTGLKSVSAALLWEIFVFFGKAGAFVFGSGLAIVPFLYGGVVREYAWLNDRQFIDAVAVAMITPGPVVITVGFIGFLVAGFWGATVAGAATFLPCYLFTVIPAPYFKKYAKRKDLAAFVTGVTAAATGAIAGAVIVLGKRSVVDWPTLLIAIASAAVLLQKRKIPEPMIVGAAALAGLFIHSS